MDLTNNQIENLSNLAKYQLDIQKKILAVESELKYLKDVLLKVSTEDIPLMMDQLGMQEFKLNSGESIKIKDGFKAYINKPDEIKAFKWIRSNGGESIIKTELKTKFGMGEDQIAAEAVAALKKLGADVEKKEGIHFQTLNKWVKEKLEEGHDIDPAINIMEFRESVIKL